MVGRRGILESFGIPLLQAMCITPVRVHKLVLTRGFTAFPIAARLFLSVVLLYVNSYDIFANGGI